MKKLNVVIIGAGMAGLCAAKNARDSGHSVVIFEQTAEIGGTWVYTDATGVDEFGLDIHTSMYHNLHTNLPKEIMGFREFLMPSTSPRSYISSAEVLSYLRSYADHFNLAELIKFTHYVIRVRPIEETKWEVIVKNLETNVTETQKFDAIFVCHGHNTTPSMPTFLGMGKFQGRQLHSHNYRRAKEFQDKTVLVIGAGPSGIDIVYALIKTAEKILFSHHAHSSSYIFPSNVVRKGSIKAITETGAIFDDGSVETCSDILYCTGYKSTFPFLSVDCGIHVDENCISPLYKHCINIDYPTMALIGYTTSAAITQMIDIQVRFCMRYLNGDREIPTKTEMLDDTEQDLAKRWALGWRKKKAHSLADNFQVDYYNQLANIAEIENVRKIFLNIYEDSNARRAGYPHVYRSDTYKIIDDEHFERSTLTMNGTINSSG